MDFSNLADLVIANNEKEQAAAQASSLSNQPEYFEDDLGFLVQSDITKNPFLMSKYLLFRILKLHDGFYIDKGELYYEHTRIKMGDVDMVMYLTEYPGKAIDRPIAIWIYRELRKLAPELSDKRISLCEGLAWDKEAGAIVKTDNIKTVRDKKNGRR